MVTVTAGEELKVAAKGIRFKAAVFDLVLLAAVTVGLHALILGHFRASPGQNVLLAIPAYLYYPLLALRPARRRGQTLGKQYFNLRVIRNDGGVPQDGARSCAARSCERPRG